MLHEQYTGFRRFLKSQWTPTDSPTYVLNYGAGSLKTCNAMPHKNSNETFIFKVLDQIQTIDNCMVVWVFVYLCVCYHHVPCQQCETMPKKLLKIEISICSILATPQLRKWTNFFKLWLDELIHFSRLKDSRSLFF